MKPIWFKPVTLDEINKRAEKSLCEHLEIVFSEIGDNYLVASMPVDQRTIQPMGALHGGATCALAESVGSAAANYCVDQSKFVCVGMEINMNHLKPIRSGTIFAKAMPLHLGKRTQVWEIYIRSSMQVLIAASRLTISVLQIDPKST